MVSFRKKGAVLKENYFRPSPSLLAASLSLSQEEASEETPLPGCEKTIY